MRGYVKGTATALAALMVLSAPVAAEDVEVLHWWTSGGEAAALNVLKENLAGAGTGWVDMPVAGGGGEAAMTALRARVTAGDAPTAVQMLGFDIQDWAAEGALADLTATAMAEGWDKVVPAALQRFSTNDGTWVAAPVNVHSTNWVWINKAALDATGLAAPTTWEELVAVLDKMKQNGITPLGHGGQPWQDATVFDAVVLGMGGDLYQRAFIDLDPAALGGPEMAEAFNRLIELSAYVDVNFSGRDWNLASAMVINGEAGMQMMGDWAKGEFLNAGKVPGTDFVCIRFPGTQGAVTFNSDQFAMFNQEDAAAQEAQVAMAKAIMDPAFQTAFNVVKGSVPARTDVPSDAFDDCGKKGMADLAEASAAGTLYGSMAHGHAAPAAVKNATYDVITSAFNGAYADGAEAAAALAEAVAAAQ
ncbi:MAG: ABC transporter substrate-binding protein [Rhodobacteraceae bacterium]|jgi:glucose/mannose transport system substrate-binding protein|nr:ABC transporter substrate-binding protein [Paracoccaceae bacterium]